MPPKIPKLAIERDPNGTPYANIKGTVRLAVEAKMAEIAAKHPSLPAYEVRRRAVHAVDADGLLSAARGEGSES